MSGWRKRGFGKHEYYRDKKLLELAEGEPCLLQVAKNCLGGGMGPQQWLVIPTY